MRYLSNLFLISLGSDPKFFDANGLGESSLVYIAESSIRGLDLRNQLHPCQFVGRREDFPRVAYLP